MSDKKQTKTPVPTILTLTLPDPGGEGTLLIQRGELAHVRQFTYTQVNDIAEAVQAAMDALVLIESNPPVIHDVPPAKTATKAVPLPEPEQPKEPTIDIPVKKGVLAVPKSYLKITGGETDEAAYQEAVQIARKLLTGGLWDGKTPICIDDVDRVQRKLKGLTDKELSLFTLEDFAQNGTVEAPIEDDLTEVAAEISGNPDHDPLVVENDEQGNHLPEQPDTASESDQPNLL